MSQVKLTVLKSNQLIAEYDFSKEKELSQILIGRAPQCHVLIDHPQISREHARLSYQNNHWFVENLNEYSPLILNGLPVEKSELNSADLLQIPPFTLSLQINSNSEQTTSLPLEEKTEVIEVQNQVENEIVEASEDNSKLEDDAQAFQGEGFDQSFEDTFGQAESEETTESFGFDDALGGDQFAMSTEVGEKTGVFTGFLTTSLRLFGEYVPYDKYTLEESETKIGRDDQKCDIVLNDDDVSSVHALIKKVGAQCTLVDQNSTNGTLLNGERINSAQLKSGDEFVIGSTTFTFEVVSSLLQEEKDRLMPIEANQEITREEIVEEEVDFSEFHEAEEKVAVAKGKTSLLDKFKNLSLIGKAAVVGGLLFLLLELLPGDDEKIKKTLKSEEDQNKQTQVQPPQELKPKHSPEELELLESHYLVGLSRFEERDFEGALQEFMVVSDIDPDYKQTASMLINTKNALAKIEELKKEEKEEQERLIRLKKVEKIVEKAKEAVKERRVELSQALFAQIAELDPENLELSQLRIEIESYVKEQERIALEKKKKEELRQKMLADLAPGKTFFLNQEWHKAVLKLQKFIRTPAMDEDLLQEASQMIKDAQANIKNETSPLISEARALKEGQDLKRAYETYAKVREIDPGNEESLSEMEAIRERLDFSSRTLYREGLIAESLSLFDEAKEKFQQVQQISPNDSDYYIKATKKLKEYQ